MAEESRFYRTGWVHFDAPDIFEGPDPIRKFKQFQGTYVEALAGKGTEDDVYRIVQYWFDGDGKLINAVDPEPPKKTNPTSKGKKRGKGK